MAQHFQFSQYNFTPQRINPAMVSTSNYASVGLLYRNQGTGGGFNLNSTFLSASYPFISRRGGVRWSGVGISLMDDRSGGYFNVQEAALSYAINVPLSKYQTLSLGAKGLFQQRQLNLDGLFTGAQYIPDRGFDESVASGENFGALKNSFFTTSLGLYWQQTDRDNHRVAYWGVSFFDFNKPKDSFMGVESTLSSTLVGSLGLRMYREKNLSIMPEVLYTRTASNNVFNIGAVFSYDVRPTPNQLTGRFDLITKYVIGRSGIVGIQLHKENVSFGLSYDFPVIKKNAGNTGAFEIGIELRRLVDPRVRDKRARARKSRQSERGEIKELVKKEAPKDTTITAVKAADTTHTATTPVVKNEVREKLQQKQDSVLARAEAGGIEHQPLVIEKVSLHFNFEFNSDELDKTSVQYLRDLSEALTQERRLKVKLTGHTDNIGSDRFNERLSVQRAENIKRHLMAMGVDASRIVTEGRGESEPLNDNSSDELRARNRRVDLTIVYE
ncbi:MAG: PorP/SprF family type IX secretion system membrane protein [Bacteroidia bacterium]|nr:PorP/SprF family type IX secretion system membrane protein [Bacteroidia bacterium]